MFLGISLLVSVIAGALIRWLYERADRYLQHQPPGEINQRPLSSFTRLLTQFLVYTISFMSGHGKT